MLYAGDVREGELCSTDWPEGCLGYAFNLVRPTQSGLRAEVLYRLMGKTLVFTTFKLASSYAQFVTQASVCLLMLIVHECRCHSYTQTTQAMQLVPDLKCKKGYLSSIGIL